MKKISDNVNPAANAASVVAGNRYRFTILTSRLIRIEYNENGKFTDLATQTVVNREFPVPGFDVTKKDGLLVIRTANIEVKYYTEFPFSENSLTVNYLGDDISVKAGMRSSEWHFGQPCRFNLMGTARTLDGADGARELEEGIMSMGCITVLDDSTSLVITKDGWVEPRYEKYVDQYLFCYGKAGEERFDYYAALRDFYRLTGKTPLIPRYALGNWWSRYYAYTQQEYIDLMKRFKAEEIPFSVAVLDMDWHYVNIYTKYGSGWTGYTWNEKLFPNHKSMLDFLHNEGMKVSLNLHPQAGVAAHEKQYRQMAEAMGIDPSTEIKVDFDIADPKFLRNYLEIMHHPLEEEGVDFWWIDWQQGNTSKQPGLDPLWMLNHYHYYDNERDGNRPLILSRYSGPGSHRYPLGFSGDTTITWESLQFQPYFTANAANIGYGWWSHDIGGHMDGVRDDELVTRWFQLGVFSPINRLHSSSSRFMGKEPWKYCKICEISMKKFLQLRHELIPYLYSMNYRASNFGEPLVSPMYYKWKNWDAFEHKTEYLFGSEMIVSPVLSPAKKEVTMGAAETYFPEGMWFDFFSGNCYAGGKNLTVYRDICDMPVFVKAGGIIPMAKLIHINDTENPKNMLIKVFAGNSNEFELYEDDGETFGYKNGEYAITKMRLEWAEKPIFTICCPEGDMNVIPRTRNYEIVFYGFDTCGDITVTVNDVPVEAKSELAGDTFRVFADEISGKLEVTFNSPVAVRKNNTMKWLESFLEKANISYILKDKIYALSIGSEALSRKIASIEQLEMNADVRKAIIEILTAEQ